MSDPFLYERKKRKFPLFFGCMFPVIVITVFLLVFGYYVTKQPFYKGYKDCYVNLMFDLGPALDRYYDTNNSYPNKIEDLQKGYLKNKNAIYCPKSLEHGGKKTLYELNKSANGSDDWALKCKNHIIFGQNAEMLYFPGGKVTSQIVPKK